MRYGVPYKGSKNSIAEWVYSHFPKRDNFYDLFAGGCAILQVALMRQEYKNYFANDIDDDGIKLFMQAVNGDFAHEERWISRSDFFKLKDLEPYIKYCWSFGNNGRDYLYSKEIEPYKKALHYAVYFHDYELSEKYGFNLKLIEPIKNIYDRYLNAKKIIKNKLDENTGRDLSLERLHQLEELQSLQSLQSLQLLKGDYERVKIKSNSVVFCFDKETEILTESGWKNIGECTLDDYCLSRKPNTGKLEWVKVINLISYHYQGKMYQYIGKNVDLCVTPNHRMFVKKTYTRKHDMKDMLIPAEEMCKTPTMFHFISAGGTWEGDTANTIKVCDKVFDKLSFAYLLGIFLTDGSVNNQGCITISQSKENIKLKIKNCLDTLGIEYNIYETKSRGINTYYIARKYLSYFEQFYRKENRHIPQDVKNWDKMYLEKLLEGLLDGDGDGEEKRRIILGSKTLVDDIQEILYKCGLSSCYKVVKPKTTYYAKEKRYITGKKEYYIISINHKNTLNVLAQNQNWVDYNDVVNCVTLEKWHTVLVRRNGKCIWCGQCDIPYRNTNAYGKKNINTFDYDRFFDWCKKQEEFVFICEYAMPSDFVCIDSVKKTVLMDSGGDKKAYEKIFIPKHQEKMYREWKLKEGGWLFYE